MQGNWQHHVHKTKTIKTKSTTQYALDTTIHNQTHKAYTRFQMTKYCLNKEYIHNYIVHILRDRPFNLKGGGHGFLFRSEIFFSDNT